MRSPNRSNSRERRPRSSARGRRSPTPERRRDSRRDSGRTRRSRSADAQRSRRRSASRSPRRSRSPDRRPRQESRGGSRFEPRGDANRHVGASDMRSGDSKYGPVGGGRRTPSPDRGRFGGNGGRYGGNGSGYNKSRFHNAESDAFFEERKRERDAIQFSIWATIPSPPPQTIAEKKSKKAAAQPPSKARARSLSSSPSASSSSSSASSSSESDDSDRRRRSRRKKTASSTRKSHRRAKSSSSRHRSTSRRDKKKPQRSSRRKTKRRASSSSSSSSSSSDSDGSNAASATASRKKKKVQRTFSDDDMDTNAMDDDERREAEKFKAAVQGARATADDSDDNIGPQPLAATEETAASSMDYGKALLPGEGAAIAQFVQKNMRIPRRGEVGWNGPEIENLETLGYVMSGSRHAVMNAVRIRKENQVYSAEEKRALALINFEEKQQRENAIMNDFKEMLTERLTKKHGARLVEDMGTSSTKAAME